MVVGNVAGNGDASAANGNTPANICKAGLEIALNPLPSKPESNPTILPIINMITDVSDNGCFAAILRCKRACNKVMKSNFGPGPDNPASYEN